jgi:cobaltochelatase CobN
LGGEKLNKELGNQLADTVIKINSGVTNSQLAAGAQSSTAWMIYMAQQGVWEGDAKTVQKLVDTYMQSVIDYGVACCHHTCKNLAWNAEIIQLSSLTPAQKQKFAEILAQATNTDPLYQMEQQPDNQGQSGDASNGNQNANTLTNNTSQDKSDGSSSGGKTAFGVEPSDSGNAKSASDSQSSQGSSSAGSAKSYELSEKQSASKSVSTTESSMPIFVIIAVIILIAIFLVGYLRNDDDDYDDY